MSNIQLLHEGSRLPEIIEWYYQYQVELYRRNQFLTKSIEVTLHVKSPVLIQDETCKNGPMVVKHGRGGGALHSDTSTLFNIVVSDLIV